MRHPFTLGSLAAALISGTALTASAAEYFDRIASFPILSNLPADADRKGATVAEIISANEDGTLLIYTDSPRNALGFIDIADPTRPKAGGMMPVGGEPTSVKVVGNRAIVAVNTSESFTKPSGKLVMVDLATRSIAGECPLPGQPDSVAAAAGVLAVAIENERDEKVNDGALAAASGRRPVIAPLTGNLVDCAALRTVELTGLAAVAPGDPEPEYVDVSEDGKVVVTLQENNHIAIVDGKTGRVESHFSAGAVDLNQHRYPEGRQDRPHGVDEGGPAGAGRRSLDRRQSLRHGQ